MMKKVLIVGANFSNKGAQSMLFVTIDELKKRIGDCDTIFAGCEKFDTTKYSFRQLFYSENAKKIALGEKSFLVCIKCFCKDVIKFLVGRHNNLFCFLDLKKEIRSVDLIIDISGFNLGKKWDKDIHESYLNNIRLAKRNNIPIVMMPQSFGPFDYSDDMKYLLDEIDGLMQYPKIVFAREEEGYKALVDCFKLDNVQKSADIVLQNKGIDTHNIYRNCVDGNLLPKVISGSVAIVPNSQCFAHGDTDKILKLYHNVISHLVDCGKQVYIFRHSKEDLDICKMIFNMFDCEQVKLLENDFSCLEYDKFIDGFEFVICSRFHGGVHAYRNCIPCILLGWAIKYKELAQAVGQEEYVFDITDESFDASIVNKAVDSMIMKCDSEKNIIKKNLFEIQKNNCFDIVDEVLELSFK